MLLKNSIANVLGKLWGFFSVYAFTPIFLHLLGAESFGLITVYTTALAAVVIFDLGLSSVLQRELPRLKHDEVLSRNLIALSLIIGYSIAFTLTTVCLLQIESIANHLLPNPTVNIENYSHAVALLLVAVFIQIPTSIYIATLMAREKQVLANKLLFLQGVARTVPAIGALHLYESTIYSYSITQVGAAALTLFLCHRSVATREAPNTRILLTREAKELFVSNRNFQAGTVALSFLSVASTQIDKIFVTGVLGTKLLGFYAISSTIALLPLTLGIPVAMAFYPRLIAASAHKKINDFRFLYRTATGTISVIVFPVSAITVLAPDHVLNIWGIKSDVVAATTSATSILSIAQLLQATTIIPYYVCLCYGNVLPSIITSIIFISALILQYTLLSPLVSIEGISYAFLWATAITIPGYMLWVHRLHMREQFTYWLTHGVFTPTILSFSITHFSLTLLSMQTSTPTRVFLFFTLAMTAVLSALCILLANSHLRSIAIKAASNYFNRVKNV